jgi:hypothetical protein
MKYMPGFLSVTGAAHQQPGGNSVIPGAVWVFTPDFTGDVDLRGALDAPDTVPSGGVRAFTGSELTLGWSHLWREGRPLA